MADPYLALTLDAKRRIAQVASALQHPHPGAAAWGLWELLEDVWRRKDPAVSAELLSASFGPDPRVGPMLVAFRFLEVVGDGAWTLAKEEADRLLLTHRQRVAAGKARSASAGRSAGGSFQRSTSGQPAEHQRPASGDTSDRPALTASSQQPAAKKKILRAADAAPPEGETPEYQATVAALFTIFREDRGRDPQPDGKNWTALKRLRARHSDAEIIRRWGNGVPAKYKRRTSSFVDLENKWDEVGDPEPAQAPARRPTGAATAADTDWSNYDGPEVSGT